MTTVFALLVCYYLAEGDRLMPTGCHVVKYFETAQQCTQALQTEFASSRQAQFKCAQRSVPVNVRER